MEDTLDEWRRLIAVCGNVNIASVGLALSWKDVLVCCCYLVSQHV